MQKQQQKKKLNEDCFIKRRSTDESSQPQTQAIYLLG